MRLPTCICEVCGVVERVVDGSGLGLIELLVFNFFELDHYEILVEVCEGVEKWGRFYCYCGGKMGVECLGMSVTKLKARPNF